jgi:hypothetical protein
MRTLVVSRTETLEASPLRAVRQAPPPATTPLRALAAGEGYVFLRFGQNKLRGAVDFLV